MITENVNRIKDMEKRMRRARKVLKSMEYALDEWDLVNSDIKVLNKYLGSDEWKADLNEDGIWDLLVDHRVMMQRLFELIKNEQK